MNEQTPNAADASQLQFDQAEFVAPTAAVPTCVACQQTIPDHYFQVNGGILCERCSTAVSARLTGGSPFLRFVKACIFGFGAAVAGFVLYFGVLKLTGWEIGLISIVVGFMVGSAVRKGSEGRGGVLYQITAVFFTYLAIAVSYSALVIPQMLQQMKAQEAANAQPAANQPAVAAKAEEPKAAADQPAAEPVAPKEMTPVDLVIGIAMLLGLLLALPIITGFSQPIGLAIVAFALWEAFKLNKKAIVVITGPHKVGTVSDEAPAHA